MKTQDKPNTHSTSGLASFPDLKDENSLSPSEDGAPDRATLAYALAGQIVAVRQAAGWVDWVEIRKAQYDSVQCAWSGLYQINGGEEAWYSYSPHLTLDENEARAMVCFAASEAVSLAGLTGYETCIDHIVGLLSDLAERHFPFVIRLDYEEALIALNEMSLSMGEVLSVRARTVLSSKWAIVERIAESLMTNDRLTGMDLMALFDGRYHSNNASDRTCLQ